MHGKCQPDELLKGSYEIPAESGGTYAFVFDNTFSKNTSKTVHFSQRVVSSGPTPISYDQRHGVAFDTNGSSVGDTALATVKTKETSPSGPSCFSDGRHLSGVMLKKRRKKLQGYAKRYFSLDYKYGTLSYFASQNSSILRGSMPIKLCVVSARETSRDIYIDSGMEVWNVKALNSSDFKTWVSALEVARLGSTLAQNSPQNYSNMLMHSVESNYVAGRLSTMFGANGDRSHTQERNQLFARMETLVNRLGATAERTKKEAEKSESSTPDVYTESKPPAIQRRPSFWRRRSMRPAPQASGECSPTEAHPPMPKSPLLTNALAGGSVESLSNLDLKDKPAPPVSKDLQKPAHLKAMKEISIELNLLLDEFKDLLVDSKKLSQKMHNPHRSVDASSIFSDEFFDAEEFNDHEGVVYLEQNEYSSEDDLVSEDDVPSDDEIHTFTNSTSQLPTPLGEKDTGEATDLYPLSDILEDPIRRKTVPMAVSTPPNFLTIIRKNVGKDMSSVAMPVTANEPINILQRFAETFEHTRLIDKALEFSENSPERILYISTFAAVFIASAKAKERSSRKPFNPLLGETFELVRKDQGIRLIAEKVSHRPQIMALQVEAAGWTIHYAPSPHQQIWGKSVELNNKGTVRLTINSTHEVYEWSQPTTFLRNIIAGEKYSEPVGSLTVSCSNGWRSVYDYKAGGMFSGRSEELMGRVFSPDGSEKRGYSATGKWTGSIEMTTPEGKTTIWNAGNLVENFPKRFGFTEFTASLNEITSIEDGKMAPTDSRLRPDQRMYENGDCDGAERTKLDLEQRQRVRRSELESLGDLYRPTFFELDEKNGIWSLKKDALNYWNRRRTGDWKNVSKLF